MARRMRIPTALGDFPRCKTVRMMYLSNVTIDAAAATTGVHVFRLNDIYDPDATGIGQQPQFHDTYAGIYTKYEVVGCRISATFMNSSGTVRAYGGIEFDDDTTHYDSYQALLANNSTKNYKLIGILGTSGALKTVTRNWSQRKWLCKGRQRDIAQDVANFGASPERVANARIFIHGIDDSENPAPMKIAVRISYIVKMYERKEEPMS